MSLTKVSAGVLNIDDLYGFRNRIINGDMRIDQRNEGAAVTLTDSTAEYTLDRWRCYEITDGVLSVQQSTEDPPYFQASLKVTVTTADASLASGQLAFVNQQIEGYNIADFEWGSSEAKDVTLSFWVRSSVTGQFGGAVRNNSSRGYPFSYTINAADTWEYKTVTIPGDTTGTWLTDNGQGIRLYFSLGDGGNTSATAGVWNDSGSSTATGQTNLLATLNATWYLTGVQLEVGSVATPFERRPYGTELALCQRYYFKAKPGASGASWCIACSTSATEAIGTLSFPTEMRIAPTALETTGTASDYTLRIASNLTCTSVPATGINSTFGAGFVFYVASGLTAGQAVRTRPANGSAYLAWSAEL